MVRIRCRWRIAVLLVICTTLWPAQLAILASDDLTGPTIVSMTVTPSTIPAGGTVTVDVRITDADSGVAAEWPFPYVYYRNAGGSTTSAISLSRVSGTAQDGVYRGESVQIAPRRAFSWIDMSIAMPSSGCLGPSIALAAITSSPV